ncbi:MAG: 4-(cytidine 5'-diphospho)-2-C-methyl-D-erythritol kinase [Muribaculaceae bacterium]|nr:4-(cytidine 5'-diphospho)-2-C-methyl-D-erythritol kinase [Muribaculaceae bacterium]
MITFPNAKINLGLHVVARRGDGYHNLETVFYPIPLCDALEIVPSGDGEAHLHCYGRSVDCPPEKNLVMRAFRLLERECGVQPVDIHLYKRIPDGAGLGGGSSDAAHTLLMLNEMSHLGLSLEQLACMAATLGADCPFFVYNRPMLAHGIGDELTPVDLSLTGRAVVLVKPPVSVSTAQAYARVTPAVPPTPVQEIVSWPVELWDGQLINDFEPSVFALHPELWSIKLRLLLAGADYAAMSGSGSAIFGIFRTDRLALAAAKALASCGEVFTLPLDHGLSLIPEDPRQPQP